MISRLSVYINKKRILMLTIIFQIIMFNVIYLDEYIDNSITKIIRVSFTIIYLLFIPGFIIIRLINLDRYLSLTETILFTVGLDVSILIFWGVFINFIYPLFGIERPFSELPLIIGIFVLTMLLCTLCCFRVSQPVLYSINIVVTPVMILVLILPFLSIFGTYLLNYKDDNTLLLLLFGIISLIPILIILDKAKEQEYPLILWTISLSLLLYGALVNPTNTGEKYMPEVIRITGIWDPTLSAGHNPLLPNVILHPLFIILCDICFLWEVRIVHPLIFSIVPVLIYQTFKKQVNNKIAFLASFFFVSIFPFYKLLAQQIRTPMAIFFLCFLEFLIVDNKIPKSMKSILILIFSFLLIASHYGTSYIFMIILVIAMILIKLFEYFTNIQLKSTVLLGKLSFLFLYCSMALGWYIFTASGVMYNDIVKFFHHFIEEILTDFLSPKESYTLYALKAHYSLSIEILEKLYMAAIVFMTIGVFTEVYKSFFKFQKTFNDEYLIISIVFLGILLSTLLPTKAYNTARVVAVSSTFLAPFCVLGGIQSFKIIIKIFNKFNKLKIVENVSALKVFAAFLLVFFLFNTGFISETITRDYAPYSVIGKKRIMEGTNIYNKIYFYRMYSPECDIFASAWITKHAEVIKTIYADFFVIEGRLRYRNDYLPEYGIIPGNDDKPKKCILKENITIKRGYIFLGYHNLKEGFVITHWNPPRYFNVSNLLPILKNSSKIYTNGGSEIYFR